MMGESLAIIAAESLKDIDVILTQRDEDVEAVDELGQQFVLRANISFFEFAMQEQLMSPAMLWVLDKGTLWGQAAGCLLCVMWCYCIVRPSWVFPKTTDAVAGGMPLCSIYLIA